MPRGHRATRARAPAATTLARSTRAPHGSRPRAGDRVTRAVRARLGLGPARRGAFSLVEMLVVLALLAAAAALVMPAVVGGFAGLGEQEAAQRVAAGMATARELASRRGRAVAVCVQPAGWGDGLTDDAGGAASTPAPTIRGAGGTGAGRSAGSPDDGSNDGPDDGLDVVAMDARAVGPGARDAEDAEAGDAASPGRSSVTPDRAWGGERSLDSAEAADDGVGDGVVGDGSGAAGATVVLARLPRGWRVMPAAAVSLAAEDAGGFAGRRDPDAADAANAMWRDGVNGDSEDGPGEDDANGGAWPMVAAVLYPDGVVMGQERLLLRAPSGWVWTLEVEPWSGAVVMRRASLRDAGGRDAADAAADDETTQDRDGPDNDGADDALLPAPSEPNGDATREGASGRARGRSGGGSTGERPDSSADVPRDTTDGDAGRAPEER